MAKYQYRVPKWRNFAQSGHTAHSIEQSATQKGMRVKQLKKAMVWQNIYFCTRRGHTDLFNKKIIFSIGQNSFVEPSVTDVFAKTLICLFPKIGSIHFLCCMITSCFGKHFNYLSPKVAFLKILQFFDPKLIMLLLSAHLSLACFASKENG